MNKKFNYIYSVIIIVLLLGVLFLLKSINRNNDEKDVNNIKYVLVDDYSSFFTINSCAYKYVSYLSTNKTEDILNMLDKDYINKNNINSSNLFSFVSKLNGNYNFSTKKIYFEHNAGSNLKKYYVYGYLIEDKISAEQKKEDYYLIINMDLDKNLFSVIPSNSSEFNEVENGK